VNKTDLSSQMLQDQDVTPDVDGFFENAKFSDRSSLPTGHPCDNLPLPD